MKNEKTTNYGKKIIHDMSQISMMLDNYDDIFSDFDSREYSQKLLSDDFLIEAKKVSVETISGSFELRLLIPSEERDEELENVIKKRLRENFKHQYKKLIKEHQELTVKGTLFIITGVIIMLITAALNYFENNFIITFLFIIGQPAGWFFFWEGLGLLMFKPKLLKNELIFYRKMARCEIKFIEY
ncbi:hypothetical protein COS64_01825 [archaeon CG06_land_8_20_14_3_00_37_11]|nr:MAG: hypothetical protein COS64_01825 [archaeon CG06_land_8_20_14_3_00_37_11]